MGQLNLNLLDNTKDLISWDDVIIGSCNKKAYNKITSWPHWQRANQVFIYGGVSSGKTTLGLLWARKAEAICVKDHMQCEELLKRGGNKNINNKNCYFIDDIDEKFKDHIEVLFHFLNHMYPNDVVITAKKPLTDWVELPDVLSRLRRFDFYTLDLPDDETLIKFVNCQFSVLQLQIKLDVIKYIIKNIRRDFKSALAIVDKIKHKVATKRKNVTISLVREVIIESV